VEGGLRGLGREGRLRQSPRRARGTRIARQSFELRASALASVVCWGRDAEWDAETSANFADHFPKGDGVVDVQNLPCNFVPNSSRMRFKLPIARSTV
jgi:hypothetical protein